MDDQPHEQKTDTDFSNRWRNTVGSFLIGTAVFAVVISAIPVFSSWFTGVSGFLQRR